jgi:3-hydroxypropanoate dehydrogenase
MKALDQQAIEQLFFNARTFHGGKKIAVEDHALHRLYELMKWAPTSVNGSPIRIKFIRSTEAKEKIIATLLPKNIEKTRSAPVTAIIAEDLNWYEHLPRLMPHADYYSHFNGNKSLIESTSFRNSSLQGAYLIMAARALGLDCGPMSGFDNDKLDTLFFHGTSLRSNFLCNLGHGDPASLHPRSPRLKFDEVCEIL